MSLLLSQYRGKTILALGAHPDDLELGMGGTLALLSRGGAKVVMGIVSIPNNLESRRIEARRAAKILGCEIRFLNEERLSRVEDLKNHELVGAIDRWVREFAPTAVFTHSLANYHFDHKLVYEASMASQRLRYFDLFCYPPTSTHFIDIPFHAQAYIDISDTIDLKMESIRAHVSQFGSRSLDTSHYKETAARNGKLVGVDYAEGIEIMRVKLLGGPVPLSNGLAHENELHLNGLNNGDIYEKKKWQIETAFKNGAEHKKQRDEKTAQ